MSCTVAVVGAGPIGAATAYELTRRGVPGVTLVGGDVGHPAYRFSGGSVCWHRDDPAKAAMIKATADFVRDRVAAGAPIRVRETPYLFLDAGVLVPALNIAAADLVADLVRLAAAGGADLLGPAAGGTGPAGPATDGTGPAGTPTDGTGPAGPATDAAGPGGLGAVRRVEPAGRGHRVVGETGTLEAEVVVLALGTGNSGVLGDGALPGGPAPVEKRQLFVLDLPVGPERAGLPHLIAPVGPGFAYVFVKQTPDGLRLLLGQEDLIEDADLTGPVDHLAELLDAGVADRFPFLRGAAAEQVLWGVDHVDKHPSVVEHARGLLSVHCGSAVRSCVPIGRRAADAVTATLGGAR